MSKGHVPPTPSSSSPSTAVKQAGEAGHPARPILEELAGVLEAERIALVKLDREAISNHAARKLELDQALLGATRQLKLGAEERELLARVRERALANQLLLAHARSCVQGVLSLLTPANSPRYNAPGHSSNNNAAPDAPPIALNLRR
jgi:hypothetical protein